MADHRAPNGRLNVGAGGTLSHSAASTAAGEVSRRAPPAKLGANWLSALLAFDELPSRHALRSLFLVSFATLYVEVVLIRWIGTEVRVFAYFQNLVLIACFLGFGLGCYWSRKRMTLLLSLGAMTTLVALIEAPIRPWQGLLSVLSTLLSLSPDAALWGFLPNMPRKAVPLLSVVSIAIMAVFLLLLVAVMVPLGQWVGACLDAATNPITAYSVNLLGSVAGLWAFAGMAFLWLTPHVWFGVAFLLLILLRRSASRAAMGFAMLGVCLVLLPKSLTQTVMTFWSPYQKLEITNLGEQQYDIHVNNTGYMKIANVSPDFLGRHPEIAERYRTGSSYDVPLRFARRLDRVLIVGAGAGNDAAAALRSGAGHVDAVEIDPVILSLGRSLHPEHPYNSRKVRLVLNDARAFFRQAPRPYDAIVFGLLDSHTEFSSYSNMRIDNYVYTEEAFREARRLLEPDGILILKFEVRSPWTWIGQRFYATLLRVFGRAPVVFNVMPLGDLSAGTVFIESRDPALWSRAAQPELAALVAAYPMQFPLSPEGAPPVTTDDWPYLYHRSRSIPHTYLTVSIILLVIATLMVWGTLEPRKASTWYFFLLGAGFLLLETQLISRLGLYFGATWIVNCIALTAILLVLVLANVTVARFRPRRVWPFFVLLVASLIANGLTPWHRFPYGARTVGLLLSAAYSVSVFLAGIVFSEMFRRSEQKSGAFGANIVGAVAGGVAQNVSFILGMKALLFLAAAVYGSAGACAAIGLRRSESA